MFSWAARSAPPTWCTKDPGATVNGQRKRDAVQATFSTRTANKARLHVNRAQTAETTSPTYEGSRNKALPVAVRMETSVRATGATCTTGVLMKRVSIDAAFSFDRDLEILGFRKIS